MRACVCVLRARACECACVLDMSFMYAQCARFCNDTTFFTHAHVRVYIMLMCACVKGRVFYFTVSIVKYSGNAAFAATSLFACWGAYVVYSFFEEKKKLTSLPIAYRLEIFYLTGMTCGLLLLPSALWDQWLPAIGRFLIRKYVSVNFPTHFAHARK